MKTLWLSILAGTLALAPAQAAFAQDDSDDGAPAASSEAEAAGSSGGSTAEADDDDDDDDDEGASASAQTVPPASELDIPPGSDRMPASALNGDQIGLPEKTLSSQIVTPLKLGEGGNDFQVSDHDFYLRAGQPYVWEISSEADIEYKWMAPSFFRNVWFNQIVIEDLEVHMAGPPAWLEYDATGVITIQFQTIRPGRYNWHVQGLEGSQDMSGTITVVP